MSQRAYTAIENLNEMGFERREVKLALEGLLKKTERNWEYIKENKYSALVNAVLLAHESHALETINKRDVAESSRSTQMTQSICPGEMVGLDLSDQKDNDRETVAIKEMKNMGFEENDIVPVLDRLLKESHNNWLYIELDNYSALVDGILIPEAASPEQNRKANKMPKQLKFMKSQNLDSGVKSYNWILPILPILKNAGFAISGCGKVLQKTPDHFIEMWEPKERHKYCGLGYDSDTSYLREERPKSGLDGAFVRRQKIEENSSNELSAQANQTLSTSAPESLPKF